MESDHVKCIVRQTIHEFMYSTVPLPKEHFSKYTLLKESQKVNIIKRETVYRVPLVVLTLTACCIIMHKIGKHFFHEFCKIVLFHSIIVTKTLHRIVMKIINNINESVSF